MRREICGASTMDTPVRGRTPETDKGRQTRRGADILQERRRDETPTRIPDTDTHTESYGSRRVWAFPRVAPVLFQAQKESSD